jgi:hypothetical protein
MAFLSGRTGMADASLEPEIVRTMQEELWRLTLSDGAQPGRNADWLDDLRRRWPAGPGACDAEYRRQCACRDAIAAAAADSRWRERCLVTFPLTMAPTGQRDDLLAESLYLAIRNGYQLLSPDLREPWLRGIRYYRVIDFLRRERRLRVFGPEQFQEMPWPDSGDHEEESFATLDKFIAALRLADGPSSALENVALEELQSVLMLGDGQRAAALDFLYSLQGARGKLLKYRVLAFGQRHHLALLPAGSPWYDVAEECDRVMHAIIDLERRQQGAPLVAQVGRCVEQLCQARVQHGCPPNLGCGELFWRFLSSLEAVRLLAPCWRAASLLSGVPSLWPDHQTEWRQLIDVLEEGAWRNNLGQDRPRLLQEYCRWCGVLNAAPADGMDRPCAQLALLWLHLLVGCADKAERKQREARLANVDQWWWVGRLTGRRAEVDRAVDALFREFIAGRAGC